MAVIRLPEPAREDTGGLVSFPLENKSFVMDEMTFDILDETFDTITLMPLKVSIRRSDFIVNIQDRLKHIKDDWENSDKFRHNYPEIYHSLLAHRNNVEVGVNSSQIRVSADEFISKSAIHFGYTNASSIKELIEIESKPATEIEEIVGKEGRMLARIHFYKERDRKFSNTAKSIIKT